MNQRLTKNERRAMAREQARLAREAEKKREKRNRLMLQGGVALVIVGVLAVVGLVLSQTLKPAGPGPLNMLSGGATFGKDLQVVETEALPDGAAREAREVDWTVTPVDVTVYVDYMCPGCGAFEQTYGNMLEQYVGAGDITLTVYPLNFLDSQSLGSKYSTRAANAFACTVELQPEYAYALHNRLLSAEVQPAEGTTGLTDEQLLEQLEAVGGTPNSEIRQCIKEQRFGSFISANYKQVSEIGVLGLAEDAQLIYDPRTGELQEASEPQRLSSTPTIIINGQQWVEGRDGTLEEYILKVKSQLDTPEETTEEAAASE